MRPVGRIACGPVEWRWGLNRMLPGRKSQVACKGRLIGRAGTARHGEALAALNHQVDDFRGVANTILD